ncbi:MAG: AbiJ-NTD4 domain-containing protein [Desulfomonilaceae bacterium]
MRFSQRIGKTPIKTAIQMEEMDKDLRTSLWNVFSEFFLNRMGALYISRTSFQPFFRRLWCDFFKASVDTLDDYVTTTADKFKKWFFLTAEWYDVYDFIEFVSMDTSGVLDPYEFRKRCNEILERELSGYRFVGNYICPITNETELNEIEEALEAADENRFAGVKEHISAAVSKLSNRKQPDYRNSIKESISAVESISKVISGDPKAELGKALKIIKTKISLHAALEQGFLKIYGYTSDADGIRHALMEQSSCDFEDAKYMLVSCSAFINYLIAKSQKAGIF